MNEEKIKIYEKYQEEITKLEEKILVDNSLTRNERFKLTEKLEIAVRHCTGKISFLDGTYVPPEKNNDNK